MQIKLHDLAGQLRGGLARSYLICGDETLLVEEACDDVLRAAREQGYGERSVLFADARFNWNDLLQDAASMSLFAPRRVVDVRVAGGKVGREGSEAVRRYADHPPDDTLLLMRMGRLESRQSTGAWFKALDKLGVVIQVWPVGLDQLPRWLEARAAKAGLTLAREALLLLTERVEGNLLAAVQEIEKLKLAGLAAPVTAAALAEVLEDSSRYGAFELVDATLAGDSSRIPKVLAGLRQEGVAVFAVLGALTSQLRRLTDGSSLPPQTRRRTASFVKRMGGAAGIERLLAECALVDAQGKGQIRGDPWLSLEDLLLRVCGVRPLPAAAPLRLLR